MNYHWSEDTRNTSAGECNVRTRTSALLHLLHSSGLPALSLLLRQPLRGSSDSHSAHAVPALACVRREL